MINKILVPVDGSENSLKALKMGLEMAAKFAAKLEVLCVALKNPINDVVFVGLKEEREFVREEIDAAIVATDGVIKAAKAMVDEAKLDAEYEVRVGEPAEIILDEAIVKEADCIVMGCRGLSGLQHFLLGSVSDKVFNGAKIPVFVVK